MKSILVNQALYRVINAEVNNHTHWLSNIFRANRPFSVNVGIFEGFEGIKIAKGTSTLDYQSW